MPGVSVDVSWDDGRRLFLWGRWLRLLRDIFLRRFGSLILAPAEIYTDKLGLGLLD